MLHNNYIFLALIALIPSAQATTYITYGFSGGRLGDNLSSYIAAKWLSHKYGLTLLYKPFEYSDKLALHDTEQHFDTVGHTLPIQTVKALPNVFTDNVIYEIPYSTECIKTLRPEGMCLPLELPDWQDFLFTAKLRALIAPKPGVLGQLVTPPADRISIALHVRHGGGLDALSTDPDRRVSRALCEDVLLPGVFQPHSYFINCLQAVIDSYPPDTKFYVHLFTDYRQPVETIKLYATDLGGRDIVWTYNPESSPTQNVLEDLFSMAAFNVLIMPASSYSWVASKIGNFSLVIQPAHLVRIGGMDVVDQVTWTVNGKNITLPLGQKYSGE